MTYPRHGHILVLGGTGMLAAASIELAHHCTLLTSVARTRASLERVDRAVRSAGCVHHMLALDWSDADEYVRRLAAHVRRVDSPSLTLAWLHEDALAPRIAAAIGGCERSLFFHVRSSSAGDPSADSEPLARAMAQHAHYHQVILGFAASASGSRWLTNAEISAGVLAAIANPRPVAVVGTVEPWHLRP